MYIWGLTIDLVSCIALQLAVGLCVDYAAHIGHTFMTISTGTKTERVTETVLQIGGAIFSGGGSTLLALSMLAISEAYIFQAFFKVILSVKLMPGWDSHCNSYNWPFRINDFETLNILSMKKQFSIDRKRCYQWDHEDLSEENFCIEHRLALFSVDSQFQEFIRANRIIFRLQIFVLVIIFGLFHGCVFLPVILSIIGPQPYEICKLSASDALKRKQNIGNGDLEINEMTNLQHQNGINKKWILYFFFTFIEYMKSESDFTGSKFFVISINVELKR